jgi:hypothetical protein
VLAYVLRQALGVSETESTPMIKCANCGKFTCKCPPPPTTTELKEESAAWHKANAALWDRVHAQADALLEERLAKSKSGNVSVSSAEMASIARGGGPYTAQQKAEQNRAELQRAAVRDVARAAWDAKNEAGRLRRLARGLDIAD